MVCLLHAEAILPSYWTTIVYMVCHWPKHHYVMHDCMQEWKVCQQKWPFWCSSTILITDNRFYLTSSLPFLFYFCEMLWHIGWVLKTPSLQQLRRSGIVSSTLEISRNCFHFYSKYVIIQNTDSFSSAFKIHRTNLETWAVSGFCVTSGTQVQDCIACSSVAERLKGFYHSQLSGEQEQRTREASSVFMTRIWIKMNHSFWRYTHIHT